jgi:tyrosine-protein phosphatase SIW14
MKRRPAILVLALLALGGCYGDVDTQGKVTGTTSQKAIAQRLIGVTGLENFARLNPNFYRGAQPTEEGYKQLKAMGIRTTISFRSHHDTTQIAKAAGLDPVEMPLTADLESVPPSDEEIKKFFQIVLDPARQPCYIHCAFGKDRTGTMAALYRMEIDGWTSDEALQEMQAFGYHTYYKDFARFIQEYKPRGYGKKP